MSPSASIGVNLRVTGHCSQGGRKYMEDFFSVAYQQSEDEKDLEYAFFGIYDGHGGSEAATYAKEHLMNSIVNQKLFWSDCDQDILRAIREGYIATHYAMWREQEKWPKTATGLPSTAGTTASVAFIRHGKIYIGHVGDSGIVLGYQEEGEKCWRAKPLTHDHKPECNVEKARIINSGGKVVTKSGVPRVVWNRPRIGHKGPVRRSTPIDEIPFLAVARSLGDLWSYNSALNEFVVSPDPDVRVIKIDPKTYRCLIFGTDGLWNVISPSDAVELARDAEIINEKLAYMNGGSGSGISASSEWTNPSKCLVDKALDRWCSKKMRADNTSVVTIMLDPPGPPKKEIIRNNCSTASYGLEYIQLDGLNDHTIGNIEYNSDNSLMQNYPLLDNSTVAMYDHHHLATIDSSNSYTAVPTNGYAIMTRYENNCDSNNLMYYDNRNVNDDIMMSSSPSSSSSSSSSSSIQCNNNNNNNSAVIASTSSLSTTTTTPSSHHTNELQYMNSFAESYNSLLISSYETNNMNVVVDNEIDVDVREYHSYHSLDESGIIGQDHVHHHQPHSMHQQQQHLYQQQCMSAEEGYSLTKLETRCEQQFRNQQLTTCGSNSNQQTSSFQEFDEESHHPYNQYDNITSSYQPTPISLSNNSPQKEYYNDKEKDTNSVIQQNNNKKYDDDSNTGSEDEIKFYEQNLLDKSYSYTSIDTNSLIEDDDDNSNSNNRLLFDESIQINEISSSVIEPVVIEENDDEKNIEMKSSSSSPSPYDDEEQKTRRTTRRRTVKRLYHNDHQDQTVKSTTIGVRTKAKSILIEQNENISILEPRKLRSTVVVNCNNKRNLRSRDNLAKDMKAKTTNKNSKQQQQHQQIRRNLNNYLKVSNSSVTTASPQHVSSIRTRQIQQHQQNIAQQITTVWSPRQKRSKNSPIVRRTAADSSLKNSNNNNNNVKNKPKTSTDLSTSASSVSSSSSSLIVSSSTTTPTSLSSTKRSSCITNSSKNSSAWLSGKSSVQTRNRVQKRLSH